MVSKFMQQYPSIEGSAKAPLGKPCIAFYKYDGSNLRWEWSPKKGWNKFGTRRQLFDATDPTYGRAIAIFNGIGDEIVERVKKFDHDTQRITAFTEYFGPNSFAGKHEETDLMQLVLDHINGENIDNIITNLECCVRIVMRSNLHFPVNTKSGQIVKLGKNCIDCEKELDPGTKGDRWFGQR